ncbi:MAG: hypothetical protein IOC49_05620 [Methylobacterium sp.]|nr:hypothetical protein [Methylobacterium sp.]
MSARVLFLRHAEKKNDCFGSAAAATAGIEIRGAAEHTRRSAGRGSENQVQVRFSQSIFKRSMSLAKAGMDAGSREKNALQARCGSSVPPVPSRHRW